MSTNTLQIKPLFFRNLLENAFMLALVTVLLGTAAIYGSRCFPSNPPKIKGRSGPEAGVYSLLLSMEKTMIYPYVQAWNTLMPVNHKTAAPNTGISFSRNHPQ